MRVLLLGPHSLRLKQSILDKGHSVSETNELLHDSNESLLSVDFTVSFGYRHILRKHMIDFLGNKIINLHISFLPWNKGADPNFWSFFDNTPKGVTIHHLTEKMDAGDILLQKEVQFKKNETLASSYNILMDEITALFCNNVQRILTGEIEPVKQREMGSYHNHQELADFFELLSSGWDTPVSEVLSLKDKLGQ